MEEKIEVGIDTGGTFTDLVFKMKDQWKIYKLLSTPHNPALAVLKGLEDVGRGEVKTIVHGSTVATNTLLERKGAKTALITNKGFEDILEIGRQNRHKLYRLTWSKLPPLVPREQRRGIKGRILKNGNVLEALDTKEIRQLILQLTKEKVESVAVCLLFSFAHPAHESEVGKIVKEMGLPVSLSHQILSEFREYERTSTTVINAYVNPLMQRYISHLKTHLEEKDVLRVMQSNGGSISAETAMKEPVRTILSGPAGGVVGGLQVAKAVGFKKVITFDMGGTSTDVSLIDGKLSMTTESQIAGFPVKIPMIGIHTVGAGGGSIAYADIGGSLRVGPQSAGADPGPICYGTGKEITVTDAHLFLGRLVPDYFLGGRMKLEPELLQEPFRKMAHRLNISGIQLAEGILSVINATMEKALRLISVEKGHDPRDFILVAFGGAGGLHAAFLAHSLGIPRVLIPKDPGALSALGMLLADTIKDYSLTVMKPAHEKTEEEAMYWLEPLKEKAFADMAREGVSREQVVLEPALDMRYRGQSFEITIPFSKNPVNEFHKAHKKLYGYTNPGKTIEVVNVRLKSQGISNKPHFNPIKEGNPSPPQHAQVGSHRGIFAMNEWEVPLYLRDELLAHNILTGPALVVEYSATLVIPPFAKGKVDTHGNILLEIME